ncbi:MAG: hypothetical protein ABSF69_26515 [Polyangiaceae bacterium]|jgi:hypothetical protein
MSATRWEGILIALVSALEAFKAAAHALGYACRSGIKTNAKGELVVALIFHLAGVAE